MTLAPRFHLSLNEYFACQKEKVHQTLTWGLETGDVAGKGLTWTPTPSLPAPPLMHSFPKVGDSSSLKLEGDALLIGIVP